MSSMACMWYLFLIPWWKLTQHLGWKWWQSTKVRHHAKRILFAKKISLFMRLRVSLNAEHCIVISLFITFITEKHHFIGWSFTWLITLNQDYKFLPGIKCFFTGFYYWLIFQRINMTVPIWKKQINFFSCTI